MATNTEAVFFGDAGYVYQASDDFKTDHTSFVPWTLKTGWVRGMSKQDRIRVTDLLILCENVSPHKLRVSVAVDYSPTFVTVATWADNLLTALVPEQVNAQPARESVQAMQFKVETLAPTVGIIGSGKQLELDDLAVSVGLKGGGAKLASDQKG
jgi:hypothetical protein